MTGSDVVLREVSRTDDRVTTAVGKGWMKKERRQHLYLRDSKVMDGNQSSSDLLRIVRNLQEGWSRRRRKSQSGCRGKIDGNVEKEKEERVKQMKSEICMD